MIETPVRFTSGESVEEDLRAKLARGDALAGTVEPILRHLLGSDNRSIFGDEILARVRGMVAHLARQLLAAVDSHDDERCAALADALLGAPGMLGHLHALALEWQLTERLEQRLGIDPVVPPLLQALIASTEPANHALGMRLLTAQARWCQAQRRMQLDLAELPADQLHEALMTLRAFFGHDPQPGAAEAAIRERYDEAAGRLALTAQLVTNMGGGAAAALDLNHAGAALFVTAVALGSGQARDEAVLAMHESQVTRLALALRASGLAPARVQQQLLLLHPEAALPAGLDRLGVERAAAILADTRSARP